MDGKNKNYIWLTIFIVIFVFGTTGGYLYFSKKFFSQQEAMQVLEGKGIVSSSDISTLRIYYPMKGWLQMEERKVPKRITNSAIAEAVLEEFLKGPADVNLSEIPKDTKLLGLYFAADGLLYVDLSDEFRRNFKGDALAEFLLLKSLYDSLVANLPNITDVKVLIEGKELESLGGHIYLMYPLKDMVSQQMWEAEKGSKDE